MGNFAGRQCCGNCYNFNGTDYCADRGLRVTEWSFPDCNDYCGCPFFSPIESEYHDDDDNDDMVW